jgi:hypothetical protein
MAWCSVKHRDSFTFTFCAFNSMEQSLSERLMVVQPVKKFPAFYGNRRFSTMFTRATTGPNLEPVKSTSYHHTPFRKIRSSVDSPLKPQSLPFFHELIGSVSTSKHLRTEFHSFCFSLWKQETFIMTRSQVRRRYP